MKINFDIIGILKFLVGLLPIALIILGVVLIILLIKKKIKIKFRTFTKKSFKISKDAFGLFVYEGAQGKGKTYSIVSYMLDNKDNSVYFSNIPNITNVEYTFFNGFRGLLEVVKGLDNGNIPIPPSKQVVIVYDEVFTELSRGDKLSKPIISFLCQLRKRKIIFLTTAQYWAELPITFRRWCRYQVVCNMRRFLWFGIITKTFRDAEQMKWSNEEQEFIAPITETIVEKTQLKVVKSYNTYEKILNNTSSSPVAGSMPAYLGDRSLVE